MKNKILSLTAATIAAITLTACIDADKQTPSIAANNFHNTYNIELWPELTPAFKTDPELERRIDDLINVMSLEQKVGQMVQAEITWVTPEDVKKYHLGSVLNGGGTFLHGNRNATVSDWVEFMDELYLASMDTSDGGLPIPVTYGIDAVHGNNKFIGATIYPHNIGLGATRNPALVRQIGEATAKEVLLAGIDWTFAPTLAVVRDDRWGRTYEGYSEDPEIVASYAREMVEGLQGVVGSDSFLDDHHIYATAKHWVGDGGTDDGVDQGDNRESEQDLIEHHAAAYFPAIEAGIQSIMASHNMWHGKRLHGSKYLLTNVLKQRLGFDGFIVGDWNSHGKVAGCRNDSCPQAINAGLDMFMVVEDWQAFIVNTIEQVKTGEIAMSRIDDAVRRILRVKIRSGLFDKGLPSSRKLANRNDLLGADEHRKIAKQAVRESLVLLKNNQKTLPLKRKQHVLVAGNGAHNMAKQTGGWTINWTGEGNQNSDFPGGSTIFDGIKQTVESAGGSVELNANGDYQEKPDVAIVVFGENPYAEWIGDLKSIAYQDYSHRDAKLLESLQAQNIPTVAIFLTGRPLWMNRVINASDAFVAAWLPGSEGNAIADVLFKNADNTINHDFKGKLSFSWPKKASQVVLNRFDKGYDPLFAYGYGLTYQDNYRVPKLNTENDFKSELNSDAPLMLMQGRPAENWNYQLISNDGKQDIFTASAQAEGFSMIDADWQVQGDGKEFNWDGNSPVSVLITSNWHREDLSMYLANDAALTFNIRSEFTPNGPILVQMSCADRLCGDIDLAPFLKEKTPQSWHQLSIDLRCFAQKGVEFVRTSVPFALTSQAKNSIRISQVSYTPNIASKAQIQCRD